MGNDTKSDVTSHTGLSGLSSLSSFDPPSSNEDRLLDLISSIKKLEDYVILRGSLDPINKIQSFENESSSFYVWLKQTYKRRLSRSQHFNPDYFGGDAAWNMILDLAASRIEGKRISITSACIASGVPSTTALRWISILETDDIVLKEQDFTDKRRTFVRMTDKGMDLLNSYYNSIFS